MNRLAVTSEGHAIIGKDFIKRKRQIRHLKRILNSKIAKTGSNSAKKKLKKLKRKERNHTRNYVHHIVNEILQTKSNVISMEDLTKIKTNTKKGRKWNNRHSQIPYHLIKEIMSYKAAHLGKRVVTVNPAYTSRNDFRGIADGVRKGCRYYADDGLVLDADWNAAINIANRYAIKAKLPTSLQTPLDGCLQLRWAGLHQQPNRGNKGKLDQTNFSPANPKDLSLGG